MLLCDGWNAVLCQGVFSDLLPFGALFVLATGPAFHAFGLFKTMFMCEWRLCEVVGFPVANHQCVRRFEVVSLFYMIPVLISNLPLQYMTFLVVCCLRPFQFAVMFNSVNMLYVCFDWDPVECLLRCRLRG